MSADPLGGDHGPHDGSSEGLYLGTGADGQPVTLDHLTHTVVAGSTGSGKSVLLYGLIRSFAERGSVVTGVDPSGLLFRPLPPDPWRASGLSQPGQVIETLAGLCREMDRRAGLIPEDQDCLTSEPLIVTVLEEIPGLYRALDAADSKRAKQARLYISRLLAESRKCHMITLLVAQRAEATVIGGAERAQALTRITFGCSSPEDVKLLHPEASPGLAETHIGAPPGVALLSRPGRKITRVKAPHVTYSEYARALRQSGEAAA